MGLMLDKNIPSNFPPNATGSDILRLIGIEDWNEKINYELYYKNCKPINCFYIITTSFNIATVLTTVIGLMGGISVILKIIISPILKLIRYRWSVSSVNTRIAWQGKKYNEKKNFLLKVGKIYLKFLIFFLSIMVDGLHFSLRLETKFDRMMKKLQQFNLFQTEETNQSTDIRHDQILSTRLYLILWIISVIFLTIYLGLSEKILAIVVKSSSITDVKKLQSQNFDELLCPCSKITIPFEIFTSLNFTLHQVN